MSLEINASKIINTVTFKTDRDALNAAKKAIKSIQDYAETLQPALNLNKFKTQMREMEAYAKKVANATRKAERVMLTPPVVTQATGNGRGAGRGNANSGMSAAARRADMANLRQENFTYRSGQYKQADNKVLEEARALVASTVEQYKNEEISAARMNQELSHQLDIIRRNHRENQANIEAVVSGRRKEKRELEAIARLNQRIAAREEVARKREAQREAAMKARERERKLDRLREGALSLNPGMLAGGLLGAAAYEGISRIGENLSSTAERVNLVGEGSKNIQANPNAILALSTWGQQNGVDSANVKKAIDNLKDVRERLGNTEMNSTLDPKTGKWKGGDSGINDIMNQFGWTPQMLKKYQNNPLDFVGAVVNEGQRRGMNSAQIGRLMENLGDDLMHYQRMFENHGQAFISTLDELKRTGAALTDSQIDSAHRYTVMAGELDLIGQGLSNQFLDGFMNKLDPKTITEFQNTLIGLGPQVVKLGEFIGQTINNLMDFINWLSRVVKGPLDQAWTAAVGTRQVTNSSGWYYDDSALGKIINGTKSMLGIDTGSNLPGDALDRATPLSTIPASSIGSTWTPASLGSGVAYQQQSVNVQPQIIIPSDIFTIQVNPSSTFGDILQATVDDRFQFNTKSLILDLNSTQSSTGSN